MDNNLTEAQISQFKEAFSLFDKSGRGSITSKDLDSVMRSLGQKLSQEELKMMIKQFDKDYDGEIDFQEFLLLIQKKMAETDPKEQLQQAFSLLDVKKRGYITMNDIRSMMGVVGEKLTQKNQELELKELFEEGDIDGDSKISFEDFLKVMSNR